MEALLEQFGDGQLILFAGLVTGIVFGACAQASHFCLRAATIELWRGRPGPRFAVWLLVFSSALILTQALIRNDMLDTGGLRQLTGVGSLSGALVGGTLFGVGMILARGCASRLLVLSATGNLRAFMTGLLLTIVAQASLTGIFSPLREWLSSLWLVSGPARDLASLLPEGSALVGGALLLLGGAALAFREKTGGITCAASLLTGGSIALGWYLTAFLAGWSFEPVTVQSVTFTGPSADTFMALVDRDSWPLDFGFGLVPGVFAGAFVSSLLRREFRIRTFDAESGMVRYLVGAVLMGFGGMLAGGCAVGAGITGGSVLALTSWIALAAMWFSAGLADHMLNRLAPVPAASPT
ncbi:MAG: YeeE/YedE family protein [Geminicoccaceae bacterium]